MQRLLKFDYITEFDKVYLHTESDVVLWSLHRVDSSDDGINEDKKTKFLMRLLMST